MIKTTYKPSQVILTVLSAAFFMCVGWIIYANKDNDGDNGKYGWLCFWMNSLGIYLLLLIRKQCPVVIFEEDFITVKGLFKTTTYDWPSIESVSISASEVFTLPVCPST